MQQVCDGKGSHSNVFEVRKGSGLQVLCAIGCLGSGVAIKECVQYQKAGCEEQASDISCLVIELEFRYFFDKERQDVEVWSKGLPSLYGD